MLTLIFLVIAIIAFALATLGVNARINLVPLGLAFLAASFLPV